MNLDNLEEQFGERVDKFSQELTRQTDEMKHIFSLDNAQQANTLHQRAGQISDLLAEMKQYQQELLDVIGNDVGVMSPDFQESYQNFCRTIGHVEATRQLLEERE